MFVNKRKNVSYYVCIKANYCWASYQQNDVINSCVCTNERRRCARAKEGGEGKRWKKRQLPSLRSFKESLPVSLASCDGLRKAQATVKFTAVFVRSSLSSSLCFCKLYFRLGALLFSTESAFLTFPSLLRSGTRPKLYHLYPNQSVSRFLTALEWMILQRESDEQCNA